MVARMFTCKCGYNGNDKNHKCPEKPVGSIVREQKYDITLTGGVVITTRGYTAVEKDGYTIIPDSLGKPVFMTESVNIVSVTQENMPLFS